LATLLPVTPNFSPRAARADSAEKIGFIICFTLLQCKSRLICVIGRIDE
jgi:hypothetical protein